MTVMTIADLPKLNLNNSLNLSVLACPNDDSACLSGRRRRLCQQYRRRSRRCRRQRRRRRQFDEDVNIDVDVDVDVDVDINVIQHH